MSTPDEIRSLLQARRAEIDAELSTLSLPPEADRLGELGGLLTNALESDAEREARLGTVELLVTVRAEVDAAIAKLDAGTYGTCDDCGNAISPNRLEVLPYAVQCVECAGRRQPARR